MPVPIVPLVLAALDLTDNVLAFIEQARAKGEITDAEYQSIKARHQKSRDDYDALVERIEKKKQGE